MITCIFENVMDDLAVVSLHVGVCIVSLSSLFKTKREEIC